MSNKRQKTASGARAVAHGLSTSVKYFLQHSNKQRRVVTLDHNMNTGEAFTTLAKHKILSAPVVLSSSLENPEDDGQYLGIVDTGTLLNHVMYLVRSEQTAAKATGKADALKRKQVAWNLLKDAGKKFFDTKLIVVCGKDTGFAFPDAMDKSLKDLILTGFLRNDGTPAHRVVISNMRGGFRSIVTQSDVLQFVAANPESCIDPATLASSLEKLNYLKAGEEKENHEVVSVKDTDSAIEAFSAMEQAGVTGVAIVNKRGELEGNLSASDLRGMKPVDFAHLLDSVKDFLVFQKTVREGRSDFLWKGHMECFALPPSAPLSALIDAFKTTRVHRLYVVHPQTNTPVAVITLTDLMRLLAAQ